MKITKGQIKEDRHRDIFWQRSFVENDQGEILCKIIISATQEFLSMTLKTDMVNVRINDDMKKWFEDKTENLYVKAKNQKDFTTLESLFDIYPQSDVMLEFVHSIQ